MWNFFRRKASYEIYTDGSWKHGRGAWAYVIMRRGLVVREASGSLRKTNSHRMEFQAAIAALQSLERGSHADLFSDSRVVIDTMNLWVSEWKALGWKKKNGKSIPSVDQIQILEELNSQRQITWRWVKAHAGVPANERCDELCILARSGSI